MLTPLTSFTKSLWQYRFILMKKTVFVGMSGGVDSSLSAALLKKQGFEVVGVFIRTWHPEFIECNEEEEKRDAMRVAAHLDIPFLTFDLEDVYKKEVADYMISEYKKGRTPNPDVMCNKYVKFGAFLKKAISMGADYVATGHYSQVRQSFKKESFVNGDVGLPGYSEQKSSFFELLKGNDASKDQSYFLWTLNQDQLSKILFPVGSLQKSEVRSLARKFKIPVANKKDSQGICFLGPIDLKEFLAHYIKEKKGNVLNEKGEVVGHHLGATFFTMGERHGFTLTKKSPSDKPFYVIAKDIKNNTITVSDTPKKLPNKESLKVYEIENVNWISGTPKESKKYSAQIRYHGESLPCRVFYNEKRKIYSVSFDKPILVSEGQSIVIYDKDVTMGGGIVK